MINKDLVCFVTNIPAPYREPVHKIVSETLNGNYHVVYASKREPDREWKINELDYSRTYLQKGFCLSFKGRFIHFNPDIWTVLNKINPQIVITNSYNPTFLFAFIWAKLKGRKHIVMTDGWLGSERTLSFIHRFVRKCVFSLSSAFIGASNKSMQLFFCYGCKKESVFQSHLCANNTFYSQFTSTSKKYDLVFSGQIIKRKMPTFFLEVAVLVQKKLKRKVSVLVMGSGLLKDEFLNGLKESDIDYFYAGYVSQEELPLYYSSARIFLFPTENDPWGVVANEACAVGVPVITCENAGAAGDLILNNKNGYILPLDKELWAEKVCELLNNDNLYAEFSDFALNHVKKFSYQNAAEGILNAVQYVKNIHR